jgi:hypothetical protein
MPSTSQQLTSSEQSSCLSSSWSTKSSTKEKTLTRAQKEAALSDMDKAKKKWIENEGQELFDILNVNKSQSSVFDSDFYHEQKTTHLKSIAQELNPEFVSEQQQIGETQQRSQHLRNLAYGIDTSDRDYADTSDAESDIGKDEELSKFIPSILSTPDSNIEDSRVTRSSASLVSPTFSRISVATQTEGLSLKEVIFPQVSTRIPSLLKNKTGHLVDPKILEAIVKCETLAHCSTSSSIQVLQ